MKQSDKASLNETLRLHWRALKDLRHLCPGVFLCAALYSMVSALSPYVTVFFSARIINELAGERRMEYLKEVILLTLFSMAVLTILTGILQRVSYTLFEKYSLRKHHLFADKMLSMDFSDIDDAKVHDLRSQIRQSEKWNGWGFNQIYYRWQELLQGLFGFLGAISLTISLFLNKVPQGHPLYFLNHPGFVILFLILILGITLLGATCMNKSNACNTEHSEDIKLENRIFGSFGFLTDDDYRAMDFRIYRQEQMADHYLVSTNFFGTKGKLAKLAKGRMGAWAAAGSSLGSVLTGLVYVFVCLKSWAGAFCVGNIAQYVGAITGIAGSSSKVFECIGMLRLNVPFLKNTYEFLDIPNKMYKGSLTTEKRSDRKYEIEFRNVSFKYPSSEEWALRHVSIRFAIGERLAIVGENGSGKTTFIKLLCRLYDPQEGEILLNGIDIRKYRYDDYMDLLSVVFQDYQLLCRPLGENVAGASSYDEKRVLQALNDAGFSDRLNRMPQGLHTFLYKDLKENGVDISGGEAQKIAIARALYKDAPFIILDEPTAALDPIAEAEIYEKFNEISGDRTAIYISHRLSSCRFCDEIVVFQNGTIIQKGTHEDLLQQEEGRYYELWQSQAKYYT